MNDGFNIHILCVYDDVHTTTTEEEEEERKKRERYIPLSQEKINHIL